jgi:glycerol uptake facilitator-like aquaporin
LTAGINLFGDVCGAHFNPAVTMAVFIKEGNMGNIGFMIMIWISQIIGMCLGCGLAAGTQAEGPSPGIARLCPPMEGDDPCTPATGGIAFNMLLAEVMGTFTLCAVILSQKYNNDASRSLIAFAVGLTLTCAILMIGGISGGCLNSAVGLVQTIFGNIMLKDARALKMSYGSLWIYMVGPLTGGILAGMYGKLNDVALANAKMVDESMVGINQEETMLNEGGRMEPKG